MGYGLYFINQNGIQGISIVTSLSIIYIPIQFLKERKRGGVTAGINCLSRTYLLPGPGLDAECKMVDSPGNVPALMESILVRRDSDITQSLAYSQTLSKPQILIQCCISETPSASSKSGWLVIQRVQKTIQHMEFTLPSY